MATAKKTAGTTAKKKKPVMGSEAVARPGAKPFPGAAAKKGKLASSSVIMQVDPLFLYDIRVWDGTSWLKLGEIWFDTSGNEYWGLFQAWATYNVGPNVWIYPIDYATAYSSLAVFKTKINNQDPAHNPSFLLITQTSV
jgi:hypothetical protein